MRARQNLRNRHKAFVLHLDFLAEGSLGVPVADGVLQRAIRAVRIGLGDVVLPGE